MKDDGFDARVAAIHREVDAQARALIAALPGVLACGRGCTSCCVDELTVFGVEADLIRHQYPELLADAEPHPAGACAFLDPAGNCRIYRQRPYVCRTQGLPLRWPDRDAAGAEVEMRDICPLNAEPLGSDLSDLDTVQCWLIGPWEGRLASLQAERQGSFDLERESLRGLFRSAETGA